MPQEEVLSYLAHCQMLTHSFTPETHINLTLNKRLATQEIVASLLCDIGAIGQKSWVCVILST